jgi:hypothetical protein
LKDARLTPRAPTQVPRTSHLGLLVLEWWIHSGVILLGKRHLYSRTNFKLNRAAALAEWRQLWIASI